jgi:hypothetical protein
VTRFEKYINDYHEKLRSFLDCTTDASEQDFLEEEIQRFKSEIKLYEYWSPLEDFEKNPLSIKRRDEYYSNKKILKFLMSSNKNSKPKKKEALTLYDIWEQGKNGSKSSYHIYWEFLKKFHKDIDSSFIIEFGDKWKWYRTKTGGLSYLKGFYYTCMKNGWIKVDISGLEFVSITINTFHVKSDKNNYTYLFNNPPDQQYLSPFTKLPKRE